MGGKNVKDKRRYTRSRRYTGSQVDHIIADYVKTGFWLGVCAGGLFVLVIWRLSA